VGVAQKGMGENGDGDAAACLNGVQSGRGIGMGR